jgi:hypothetical protein
MQLADRCSMPPKAVVVSVEGLGPWLSNIQLSAQNMRWLMRGEEWNAIESRHAQIVFLVEFAQVECDITLDRRTLANLSQLSPPRIHEIRLKTQTQTACEIHCSVRNSVLKVNKSSIGL